MDELAGTVHSIMYFELFKFLVIYPFNSSCIGAYDHHYIQKRSTSLTRMLLASKTEQTELKSKFPHLLRTLIL